jgi:hypothetical protein
MQGGKGTGSTIALTRLTDWNNGDTLTEAALEAEFDNIYSNALSLISPLTGNLAAGGNLLTGLGLGTVSGPSLSFTGDTNTGLYSSTADTVDVAAGGVRGLRVNTATTGVNFIELTPAATGAGPIVKANGSDSNIDMKIQTLGTGSVLVQPGTTTSLAVARVASAVNYVEVSGAATGGNVLIDAAGSDTDVGVIHDTKGAGVHIFKVGASEKTRITAYSKVSQYVFVTANQTATQSNTTLQNITDLVFPVAASTQYFIRAHLLFTGANTTHDLKLGWTYPVSCDIKWGPVFDFNSGNANNSVSIWTPVTAATSPDALLEETDTLSLGSAAVTFGLNLQALVTNSTNAGNLQLQFSQNTSSGSDLIILKGSLLEIITIQ